MSTCLVIFLGEFKRAKGKMLGTGVFWASKAQGPKLICCCC